MTVDWISVRSVRRFRVAGAAVTASRAVLLALAVGFAAAGAAGTTLSLRAQAIVYLVGMVALNLPHGGYEHLANLRRRSNRFRGGYVGAYLLGVAGFLATFALWPVAGLGLALSVACAKAGGGGVAVMAAVTGDDHLWGRPGRLLAAAARGGAVMVVPMLAWPESFRAFGAIMVGLFDPGALGATGGFDLLRTIGGAGYAVAVVAHLVAGGLAAGTRRSWAVDAAETLLLIAYFAVVPVVVAVGLYFPLWYSLRQVGREFAVDGDPADGPDLLGGDRGGGVIVVRSWAVLVVGALSTALVAGALWALAPNPLGGADPLFGAVAFWSVFISAIALPHVAVGAVLDRERGIWHVP